MCKIKNKKSSTFWTPVWCVLAVRSAAFRSDLRWSNRFARDFYVSNDLRAQLAELFHSKVCQKWILIFVYKQANVSVATRNKLKSKHRRLTELFPLRRLRKYLLHPIIILISLQKRIKISHNPPVFSAPSRNTFVQPLVNLLDLQIQPLNSSQTPRMPTIWCFL